MLSLVKEMVSATASDYEDFVFDELVLLDLPPLLNSHRNERRIEKTTSILRNLSTLAKDDPRNGLAHIIEAAFNSSDSVYLWHTLQSLLDPACQLKTAKLNGDEVTTSSVGTGKLPHKTIEGREKVINEFLNSLITIPDGIFLVHEWKMFSRPNNGCKLMLKYSFTGSQVFHSSVPCVLLVQDSNTIIQHRTAPQFASLTSSSEKSSEEARKVTFQSRGRPIVNTIRFKKRSRACKYDFRKRQRKLTLGECVTMHHYHPGHVPEDVIGSNDGDAISADSSSLATTRRRNNNKEECASLAVNGCGIMRWTVSPENLVTFIECLPSVSHG